MELAVEELGHPFAWTVWMRVGEADFWRIDDLWRKLERVDKPPVPGTVANAVPGYPDTTGLHGLIHQCEPGGRPWVALDPASGHPLAHEQREGISPDRYAELAGLALHAA